VNFPWLFNPVLVLLLRILLDIEERGRKWHSHYSAPFFSVLVLIIFLQALTNSDILEHDSSDLIYTTHTVKLISLDAKPSFQSWGSPPVLACASTTLSILTLLSLELTTSILEPVA
jgi:hypothetical protein